MKKYTVVGLGRIGRHCLRYLLNKKACISDIQVSDLNTDIENICYLLNYDSVYGLREERFLPKSKNHFYDSTTDTDIELVSVSDITSDVIIDSTGSIDCLLQLSKKNKKLYVTHTPDNKIIDEYIIANVSNFTNSKVVSMSICDTTAIAPILVAINDINGIKNGNLVTLHPWLNYQNLSDNSVISTDVPNSYWSDYALGRKSTEALIPKTTSAIKALGKVFPDLAKKLRSWSYRVPTPVISTALLTLNLNKKVADVTELKKNISKIKGVTFSKRNLVSTDYIGLEANCALDLDSVQINDDTLFLSLWYDNEYGYSSQIIDYILKNEE